jgi:GLPGLI family protein
LHSLSIDNMKKIISLCFLIFTISIQSQSGSVEYGVLLKKIDNKTSDENAKIIIDELNNSELLFQLNFNKSESYFFEKNKKEDSELSMGEKLNRVLIGYKPYYFNKTTNLYYFNYQDVVVEKPVILNWKLLNEKKKIDNYTCYKAIYVETYKNRVGQDKERIITAWYCPDLQFAYGPLEYNNLPGLILELEKNGNKYVVRKIKLSENQSITKPKGKVISYDEYIKRLNENSPF